VQGASRAKRARGVEERAERAREVRLPCLLRHYSRSASLQRAIMLAREDPLLQRTGAIPEVYFNLRAPRERARPRARARSLVFIPFRRIYGARQMNVLRLM